jgi:hypothetical protein
MASETQTHTGTCPTHGTVEATREMPKPSFPVFVYGVRRLIATSPARHCRLSRRQRSGHRRRTTPAAPWTAVALLANDRVLETARN